jgi:hypothetical protein
MRSCVFSGLLRVWANPEKNDTPDSINSCGVLGAAAGRRFCAPAGCRFFCGAGLEYV